MLLDDFSINQFFLDDVVAYLQEPSAVDSCTSVRLYSKTFFRGIQSTSVFCS